ncbi:hypothetical protein [Streptomyces sp. NPDC052042]|uniref:hypothetical protein n=1 Tax=Streptomyces sp. NPDC052042 TaxID=3365683 RepID=UPI0037D2BA04
MTDMLLIESDAPAPGPGGDRFVEDAVHLAGAGHRTALFLVDNAVFSALPGAVPRVEEFVARGGELMVDVFSLRQRALDAGDLLPGARPVEMDDVTRRLLDPQTKVVWH